MPKARFKPRSPDIQTQVVATLAHFPFPSTLSPIPPATEPIFLPDMDRVSPPSSSLTLLLQNPQARSALTRLLCPGASSPLASVLTSLSHKCRGEASTSINSIISLRHLGTSSKLHWQLGACALNLILKGSVKAANAP